MLKKLISRLFPDSPLHKMPFWQWIDRREKIKKLGRDLEFVKPIIDTKRDPFHSEFKELYRIAQQQQELLTKK